METLIAAGASAGVLALFAYEDGINPSNDGRRYTSGKPQPQPFHRRWCGWPRWLLIPVSLCSLVALGALMGDWKRALMLVALPGAWIVAVHPDTVDAPAMLLAWGASLLMPVNPWAAVLLSCLAGFIHERGPVYAAIYAWHPLLLVGLVAVGWWRKPAERDGDVLVGSKTFLETVRAHKVYQDFADPMALVWGLRALVPAAMVYGCSPRAWLALAVAFASRLVGTDTGRFLFWAAPPLLVDTPNLPLWVVAAHALTFKRMI